MPTLYALMMLTPVDWTITATSRNASTILLPVSPARISKGFLTAPTATAPKPPTNVTMTALSSAEV